MAASCWASSGWARIFLYLCRINRLSLFLLCCAAANRTAPPSSRLADLLLFFDCWCCLLDGLDDSSVRGWFFIPPLRFLWCFFFIRSGCCCCSVPRVLLLVFPPLRSTVHLTGAAELSDDGLGPSRPSADNCSKSTSVALLSVGGFRFSFSRRRSGRCIWFHPGDRPPTAMLLLLLSPFLLPFLRAAAVLLLEEEEEVEEEEEGVGRHWRGLRHRSTLPPPWAGVSLERQEHLFFLLLDFSLLVAARLELVSAFMDWSDDLEQRGAQPVGLTLFFTKGILLFSWIRLVRFIPSGNDILRTGKKRAYFSLLPRATIERPSLVVSLRSRNRHGEPVLLLKAMYNDFSAVEWLMDVYVLYQLPSIWSRRMQSASKCSCPPERGEKNQQKTNVSATFAHQKFRKKRFRGLGKWSGDRSSKRRSSKKKREKIFRRKEACCCQSLNLKGFLFCFGKRKILSSRPLLQVRRRFLIAALPSVTVTTAEYQLGTSSLPVCSYLVSDNDVAANNSIAATSFLHLPATVAAAAAPPPWTDQLRSSSSSSCHFFSLFYMSNFLSLVRGGGETTLSGNGQNQFRRPFQTDQLSISLCRSRQEIPTAEWQNNGLVQFDCRCWAMVSQLNGNQSKYTGHGRRVHIAGLIVCLFSIRVEKQNWYLLELLMLGYFLRQSIPDGSSSRAQYGSIPYKAQHGEANHVSTSRVYMACNSQQYSPPPPVEKGPCLWPGTCLVHHVYQSTRILWHLLRRALLQHQHLTNWKWETIGLTTKKRRSAFNLSLYLLTHYKRRFLRMLLEIFSV